MSEPEKPISEIPDPIPNLTCPNCQTILSSDFSYCNSCGQKQGTKRRSLYQLFKEFLTSLSIRLTVRIFKCQVQVSRTSSKRDVDSVSWSTSRVELGLDT